MISHTKHKIPKFGWKVKLNHVFPEKRNPNFFPSLRIMYNLLFLIIRYLLYQIWCYIRGRKPIMDYITMINPTNVYGVPIGGIGGGTIGRDIKGNFCRFQLRPGIYDYKTVPVNQFIVTVKDFENNTLYQNVLSANSPPADGNLQNWRWNFPGDHASYTGLYPRSWTEYFIAKCNIKLICRQISPVIPHNYKDSSLPGCAFIWSVENMNSNPLVVTITMCMKGYENASGCDPFEVSNADVKVAGVKILSHISSMKCILSFGAKDTANVSVSSTTFNPNGTGASVWDRLYDTGDFGEKLSNCVIGGEYFGEIACAVAAKTIVPESSEKVLEFSLVWHMPLVTFHDAGRTYKRYYTKYFGTETKAGAEMCHYVLKNYSDWERQIEEWQSPILENELLPDWYKSAVFNELYYISDGGTVWLLMNDDEMDALPAHDVRKNYGRFAYLEGHEYRMYNTYDVHFYASFALADLWPMLQLSIQYEFCEAVLEKDISRRWFLYDGHFGQRKEPNSIPHDVGDPGGEPFMKKNAYNVHDVTDWKDLNLKFVLQCFRDYVFMSDVQYLKEMWPKIKILMDVSAAWDKDGDGMIENSGYPDQTYDAWKMSGISSYCGSLWLAALCVTVKMADFLGDNDVKKRYSDMLGRAKVVFNERLWNGTYYDFDTESEHSKSIMADQLCGVWYLLSCGITDDILPAENICQALQTIYTFNVSQFRKGESGAVNGMLSNGTIDTVSIQSQEVWTGVTYALASLFIFKGMEKEGFATARGIYETVYNICGLGYNTPEALYEHSHFRSVGYMRPLSIWSMQLALNLQHKIRTAP